MRECVNWGKYWGNAEIEGNVKGNVIIQFINDNNCCLVTSVVPKIVPFDVNDEVITSGQPVTLQCSVSEGDLPINFRWAFHGQELSSQMGIATVRLNARVSLLSIDSIAAGHAGNYTCTAQNSAGSVNHTATLFVQGSATHIVSCSKLSCMKFSILTIFIWWCLSIHAPVTRSHILREWLVYLLAYLMRIKF